MTSASEIGTKMRSRQCIQIDVFGDDSIPFSVDSGNMCADINQNTIDETLKTLPSKVVQRYQKYGKKYVTGKDIEKGSGPTFLLSGLQFNDKGDTVEVASPVLATEKGYWEKHFHIPRPSAIPDPGCFHYCKLLSPARVAEWVYVDSLRGREAKVNNISLLIE